MRDRMSEMKWPFAFEDGQLAENDSELEKYFTNRSRRYLSFGALGCALAHIKLMEKVSTMDDDKFYVVLEDDIGFNPIFQGLIMRLMNTYPTDADIFFLGSRNERLRDISFYCENDYCRSFNCRLGAYAYIISGKSAKKILQNILPIDLICGGIDTAIGITIRRQKIIAYQMNDSIIFHDNTISSNIYNPSNPAKILHESVITNWPNRNKDPFGRRNGDSLMH
jgi:GR25 family glycosyltransferase involved in LPS biosynthesis